MGTSKTVAERRLAVLSRQLVAARRGTGPEASCGGGAEGEAGHGCRQRRALAGPNRWRVAIPGGNGATRELRLLRVGTPARLDGGHLPSGTPTALGRRLVRGGAAR